MKIILDENIPHYLKRVLSAYKVVTVQEIGLSGIQNGELMSFLEGRYDIFVTADKNLKHQQNLATRKVAVIELYSNRLPEIKKIEAELLRVLTRLKEGDFVTMDAPEEDS